MDSIRSILSFIIKFVFAIALAVIVWWMVSLAFPMLSVSNLTNVKGGFFSGNWLPAPRNIQDILLGKGLVPSGTGNVYVPGSAYNGYGDAYPNGSAKVDFVSYDSNGNKVIQHYGTTSPLSVNNLYASPAPFFTGTQGALYVRNVSLYQGGALYTGISFVGEARETMFYNGTFPIVIINQMGQIVAVAQATATTNWSIPGWVRFQARVTGVLPYRVPCTMVFQSANSQLSQQVRVAMPFVCNK